MRRQHDPGPADLRPPAGGPFIYAADGGSVVVQVLQSQNGAIAPAATIAGAATTLSTPSGVALDATGNIYVANAAGSIAVFAAGANGNVAPVQSITRMLGPVGISL